MKEKGFIKKVGVLFLVLVGPMLMPQLLLLTGIGTWGAMFDINLIFAIFIIPLIFLASIVFSLFKKYRNQAFQYIEAIIIIAILFIPSMILTQKVRSYAFYFAGLRAEKIIVAIENFQKENKATPKTLQELIPKYLDKMPYGVPPLRYDVDKKDTLKWSLSADVGTGMLNWDLFIYASDQDYSSFSDPAEKLGKWVYIHE